MEFTHGGGGVVLAVKQPTICSNKGSDALVNEQKFVFQVKTIKEYFILSTAIILTFLTNITQP